MSDKPSKAALQHAEKWAAGKRGDAILTSHTICNVRNAIAAAFDAGVQHGYSGQYLIDPDQPEEFRMRPADAALAHQFHSARCWVATALGIPYESIIASIRPTSRVRENIGPYTQGPRPEDAGEVVFHYKKPPRD